MTALASLARSIGVENATIVLPRRGIREIDAVGAALEQANNAVNERQILIRREKDAIEAADRAKDQFIATLSHELRNPLAAITSAAAILRRNDLTWTETHDAREVIERQVAHMSRMIEDLLDLSRVITGKVNLKLERFDLAELVSDIVMQFEAAGRCKDHAVDVKMQSVWVEADRTRVDQIVTNLFDNALKFTDDGKGIRIAVNATAEHAEITISDDGHGIDAEMIGRIFDPFVQGDHWASASGGGLGLGLALVKRLVELQGGSVTAASDGVGRGATFTVRLPRVEPVVSDVATPLRATPTPSGTKRIVLIDDNDDARKLLAMLLAFEGHETHEAATGDAGIRLACDVRPDVALIDIGLPDFDGYDIAKRIRAQLGNHCKLVAVTGYGQLDDQRRAFEAGFDAHLVKPVSVEQLTEVLVAAGQVVVPDDDRDARADLPA